jgi:aldehyde:ferredoxin oxidoreductase
MTVHALKRFGSSMNNTHSIPIGDAPFKNWAGTNLEYNRSYYRHIDPDRLPETGDGSTTAYPASSAAEATATSPTSPMDVSLEPITGIRDGHGLRRAPTEQGSQSILYVNELLNRAGLDTI